MADYLKELPVQQVASWYARLAAAIGKRPVQGQKPLASLFLGQWLKNRNPKSIFRFTAPNYLTRSQYVMQALKYQRAVFLTEQKARLEGKRTKWAGILPRLKGDGYKKWDISTTLSMHYESLVEVGSGVADIIKIQNYGTAAEKDLLTSLRGFQLRSRVAVSGEAMSSTQVQITFKLWRCLVKDRYDWNYNEYFTVPNPDFASKAANAVRPTDRTLRVYHSNAKRLEDAKLAAPYFIESNEWILVDPKITAKAIVNPERSY